jgi:hypothetical protein
MKFLKKLLRFIKIEFEIPLEKGGNIKVGLDECKISLGFTPKKITRP